MSAEVPPRTKAQKDADNAKEFGGRNVLHTKLDAENKLLNKAKGKGGKEPTNLEVMHSARKKLLKEEQTLREAVKTPEGLKSVRDARVAEAEREIQKEMQEFLKLGKELNDPKMEGDPKTLKDIAKVTEMAEKQLAAVKAFELKIASLTQKKADAEALQMADLHRELAKVQNALDYADYGDDDGKGGGLMRDSGTARKRLKGIPAGGLEDVPTIAASDKERTYARIIDSEAEGETRSEKASPAPEVRPAATPSPTPKAPETTPEVPQTDTEAAQEYMQGLFKNLAGGKVDKDAFDEALTVLGYAYAKEQKLDEKRDLKEIIAEIKTPFIAAVIEATLPEAKVEQKKEMQSLLEQEFAGRQTFGVYKHGGIWGPRPEARADKWIFRHFLKDLPKIAEHMRLASSSGFNISKWTAPRSWKMLDDSRDSHMMMRKFERLAKQLAKSA